MQTVLPLALLQNVGILVSAAPLNGACPIWLSVAMSTFSLVHIGLKRLNEHLQVTIGHVPINGGALKNPTFCSHQESQNFFRPKHS